MTTERQPAPFTGSTLEWANPPASTLPRMKTESPGPRSRDMHARMERHQRGSYTAMVGLHPVAFESGQGVVLRDVDGNEYIDFSSGIVVTNLGHAHPSVAAAVGQAATELDNVHDFAHPRKVEAMEALASITPGDLKLFTFFCAGTEAVEGAMRVARAKTGKHGFVSFFNDYHGRTGGAAGVTAAQASNGLRPSGSFLVPSGHAYRCTMCTGGPCDLRCAGLLEQSIGQNMPGQMAGVVMELITNGNGATVYDERYVPTVAEICQRNGMMFIADEVATGFGRTGAWFASDHYGVVPDVMCIGKGLGNGFPVTAIAVREEHAEALASSFPSTSYGGNPMACAAIIETIRLMKEERLVEHCHDLGEYALGLMRDMQSRHKIVGEVRGKGALLAVELVKDKATREPFPQAGNLVYQTAFRNGVSWATAGHILRITPPIVMSKEIFARGLEIVEDAIYEVEREFGYT